MYELIVRNKISFYIVFRKWNEFHFMATLKLTGLS